MDCHMTMRNKDKALADGNEALNIAREIGDYKLEEMEGRNKPQMFVPYPAMMQMMQGQQGADMGGGQSIATPKAAPKGLEPAVVKSKLMQMVNDVVASDDEFEMDSPFMEAGMDSLSSVELVTQVAREFQMSLSPALIFDFPTGRAMVDHLVEESKAIAF